MSWPTSQDYNEAVQSPGTSFGDAELRAGEAATNAIGLPIPRSGAFADVYEFNCESGNRWAVKCFTRAVEGQKDRYQAISEHLARAALPFMVDFQYLPQGVRVRGSWFPILKMRWVQGLTLNEFVRENVDKRPLLEGLIQIWLRMAKRLRDAKLAHGDLQHGNVLLIPGASAGAVAVRLIDYDGMFVPALASKPSGEVGHPAYQHAQRLREGTYTPEVDRFPLLAITTALRCLMAGGRAMWDRYDNGDNLLFRETDLRDPGASPLFRDLKFIDDPVAQALVVALERAASLDLRETPHVDELYDSLVAPKKPAPRPTPEPAPPVATAFVGQRDNESYIDDSFEAPVQRRKPTGSGIAWGVIAASIAAGLACVVALVLVVGGKKPPTESEPEVVENKEPPKVVVAPTRPEPNAETKAGPVAVVEPNRPRKVVTKGRGVWAPPKGKWSVKPDGTLRAEGAVGDREPATLVFGEPTWGDYDFRADVRTSPGEGGVFLGFRHPDIQHGATFGVNVNGNVALVNALMPGDGMQSLGQINDAEPLKAGEAEEMLVKVRGGKVQAFRAGKMLFDSDRARIPPRGGVVLMALVGAGRWAEFAGIRVTDPAGTVLWEGAPDWESVSPPVAVAAETRDAWEVQGKWAFSANGTARHEGTGEHAKLTFGDPSWGDYTFRARVRTSSGNGAVALHFRRPSSDKCVSFAVNVFAEKKELIDVVDGKKETRFHDRAGQPLVARQFADLRAEARGRKVRCFKNDQLVGEYEGPEVPERGGVSLAANLNEGDWVEFAGIEVTDAAGTTLWNGVPDVKPLPGDRPVSAARNVWFPVEGRWRSLPDGRLRHDGVDFFAAVTFGDPFWKDFDFRADVTQSHVGDDYVGSAFRVIGTRRCGIFQVNAARPNVIDVLVHDQPGQPTTPVLGPVPSRVFVPGKAEELHVKVRGGKVECFRDNKLVFDYEGTVFPTEGGVGLRSWTLRGRWVEFANIKVTDPAGKLLWEGPPDLRVAPRGQAPVVVKTPVAPLTARVPVPPQNDIDAADKRLRESFRKELAAAKKPDELKALAAEVMQAMRDVKDDAPGRFASLTLARERAVAARDAELAFAAAGQIESDFEVAPQSQLFAVFQSLSRASTPATAAMNKGIVEHSFELSEMYINDGEFETAAGVVSNALAVAGKSQATASLQPRLQGRMALINEGRKAAEIAKTAELKLREDPADSVAAFEHGKYLCEWRSMWKEGLPLLAKGADADWKAAATRDLASPTVPAEVFAVGEAWSARADAVKGNAFLERNLRARAARWYERGFPRFGDAEQSAAIRGIEKLSDLRRTASVKDPSFVALFNGRDAAGWTTPNGNELRNWSGTPAGLKGASRNNPATLKSSRADFGDFYLKATIDIDADSPGNGVLIRFAPRDGNRNEGYKISLNATNPGGLSLYQGDQESVVEEAKPIKLATLKNVSIEVFAIGSRFKVQVNGEKVLDAEDATSRYDDGAVGLVVGANGSLTVKKLEVRPFPKPGE